MKIVDLVLKNDDIKHLLINSIYFYFFVIINSIHWYTLKYLLKIWFDYMGQIYECVSFPIYTHSHRDSDCGRTKRSFHPLKKAVFIIFVISSY